jgi:hypothetical protein
MREVYWRGWFLGAQQIKFRVQEYEVISSRVASLTLRINSKYHLQVIQVYAITTSHENEEIEELYKDVARIMEKNKSL